MTSDIDSEAISVPGDVSIHAPKPIPAVPVCRRQSTPVEASDEGLPSGLPTPPSEALTDDHESRVVSRLTCEHCAATDRKLISCTHLPQNFPVIHTPPSLTPEPSVEENRGMLPAVCRGSARQGSVVVFSGSLSPLTPPPLSPSLAAGSSLAEESVGDVSGRSVAHNVREEHIDSLGASGGTVVSGCDATEGVTVDVGASASTMDSRVPVITVTNEPPRSVAVSNNALSPVPQVAGDADLFVTPESSTGLPNIELPECRPDADGVTPAYSQMDGYDFRFSSPLRRPSPLTSATPSRHATPSDSSKSRPTQEEDEVWGALMLGVSGMSTPVQDHASLPLMFSHQPSHASSVLPHASQQLSTSTSTSVPELFAVDPSMLHDPPLPLRRSELLNSPRDSNGPLSSLILLKDTDVEDTERPRKKPHPDAVSVVRAASEATSVDGRAGSRLLSGPSASLSELALLARREPLKIHLRLPETMRSLKRKRDVFDGEDEGVGEEKDDADSEHMRPGASMPVDDALQEGQEEAIPAGVRHEGLRVSANVPPSRIAPSTPTPTVPQLARENSTSSGPAADAGECPDAPLYAPVPRKRTKKPSECGKEAHATRTAHASIRRKNKPKRAPKAKSPVKYHIWNGQIVSVELQPEPEPTPAPQSRTPAPQPPIDTEEAAQALRSPARLRRRKGRENQAMKTSLSSPARHPNTRSPRFIKSSPTKEDVWNTLCQDGREWPEPPTMFSHWDIQVCF